MKMDLDFFLEILGIDSTSGQERGLAEFLRGRLGMPGQAVPFDSAQGTAFDSAQGPGGSAPLTDRTTAPLTDRTTAPLTDRTTGPAVHEFEVGDGTVNLLLDWSGTGKPSFVFCTHLDTVPP